MDIPNNWKKAGTSTENNSLFKLYKMNDIESAFKCLTIIQQTILVSEFKALTFITISNDNLTITINDTGDAKPMKEIILFATELDSLLEVYT